MFGVLFLFVIVYSPAVFLDRMTYYQSFPLLMSHKPVIVGLFGFAVEVAKGLLCMGLLASSPGGVAPADAYGGSYGGAYGSSHAGKGEYAPMFTYVQEQPS